MRPAAALAVIFLATPALALDCAEGMRAFAHPGGETCIPESPQRIVTLSDQNGLLPLLELGIVPAGSAGHVGQDGVTFFRRTEGFDTSAVAYVGSYQAPDREAVAALAPDLIIASPWPEDAGDLFAPIAPTIVFEPHGQPLAEALLSLADAVGRTAEAEALQADLVAHAEGLKAALGERLSSVTTSFLSPDEGRTFWPENGTQVAGLAFDLLDLNRVPAQAALGTGDWPQVGFEGLPDHAGDLMFVFTYDGEYDSQTMRDFLSDPLVQALPVAQAGQIVEIVGTESVGAGWGKARILMDRIAEVMTRPDLRTDLFSE
ncbi:MAG: ABC transporter substrate-binding protein [Rubellimicrobium sp.]|nr:ABC transporter substrate-binding protein [Rubellimicrobium sp.]